jgi:hypothetical protein
LGKTTTAAHFEKNLLLATEKGYNAIPGVMAQPINSWAEFKQVLRQLKDSKVKEKFYNITIDTVDILYDYCTKYICENAKRAGGGFGVDSIGEIPYGQGYGMVAKEFDEALRSIVQMDYGLILISHSTDKTFTDENGVEYNKIVPTLDKRATNIVSRMADVIGYARVTTDTDGKEKVKLFTRGTPRFMAGSRFKYFPNSIDFSYDNLVSAFNDAIDRQENEEGGQYFTNDRVNIHQDTSKDLDFDELLEQFNSTVSKIISETTEDKFKEYYQPRIVQITDKYLGKGNKVNQCSREQTEALLLIVTDLDDLLKETK